MRLREPLVLQPCDHRRLGKLLLPGQHRLRHPRPIATERAARRRIALELVRRLRVLVLELRLRGVDDIRDIGIVKVLNRALAVLRQALVERRGGCIEMLRGCVDVRRGHAGRLADEIETLLLLRAKSGLELAGVIRERLRCRSLSLGQCRG